MFLGEIIALGVALSWTITALFAEVGSKRIGSLGFNTMRMSWSLLFLIATIWLLMGTPYPRYADTSTWFWLLLSGIVGYVIGDYCLMQGYIIIGSRFGQLFMTLSAPTAAITGQLLLGEVMRPLAIIGMLLTLSGIALSIFSKQDESGSSSFRTNLPAKGIFHAAMAGICQGFGLVLSKIGLLHYDSAIAAAQMAEDAIPPGAIIPIPLSISISFASTLIRAYIGWAGFFLLLMFLHKDGVQRLKKAVLDRKVMWCVLGSTIFGPFIGVSASLLATKYTSTGIAQTLFALTPILIIAPAALLSHQRVRFKEVIGAILSVCGVCLFFI